MWPVGLVAALAWAGIVLRVFAKGRGAVSRIADPAAEAPNTQQIAAILRQLRVLYGNYMFAFEIASLLLLVAIVGAVVMAKKRI